MRLPEATPKPFIQHERGDPLPRYGACGEDLPDQQTRLYCEADQLAGLLADGYHHDCQITAELW